jgi:hypothetical protein
MVERYCGTRFSLDSSAGLGMIMQVEVNYLNGMLYALVSIILGYCSSNGKLIQNHDATVISFYEFIWGVFLSLFLYENKFTADFFVLSFNNWALMLILACICICFYGSVKVMKN